MGNTRLQDLSRRPALMIARIVSRSLFDVPVNNAGQRFRRADRNSMLHHPRAPHPRAPFALKHFLIGPQDRQSKQTKNQWSNV
jgi:hypothetical protein